MEKRFYQPELDVLRFFAFLAVFVHHALPQRLEPYLQAGLPAELARWIVAAVVAGQFGLDLFFTLSAFLITALFLREHDSRGRVDVLAFYVRRALRIWPLYYVFLAAVVLVLPGLLPRERFEAPHTAAFFLFAGNWSSALLGYPPTVAAPLWSVSVEEQFYVAWPLLVLLAGIRRVRHVSAAFLVVATLTRALLAASGTAHPGVWCNTFARLDPLALGALMAVALHERSLRLGAAARAGLAALAIATYLSIARYGALDGAVTLVAYPAAALASALLVASTLHGVAAVPLLKQRALVYLGRVSYGLYVFHLLALETVDLVDLTLGGVAEFALRTGAALSLTIVLAAASYRWLERPFLRLKDRFSYVLSRPEEPGEPTPAG